MKDTKDHGAAAAKYSAAVITVSDKGAAGLREDTGGPLVCAMLGEAGFAVVYTSLVPDEGAGIEAELRRCADEKDAALIMTTGGTGFSPRDVTPEATIAVCERLTPGIPEAMRAESLKVTNRAMLSRLAAGIRGRSLIINLPGSPKAIRENLAAVLPALEHGLDMLRGGPADCAAEQAPPEQKLSGQKQK
ncbi:MAG: MogA/MoaB family molybdenum cofactor biosynthesis protein [Clostridiales Family XIII bacterium]|jgi:molybdenum cofactor synthesis domain-containing protein|nr:MogA/MoaB family molybdenum cofactor biosynthesis protein [Clostridiales Family XIII bacterium]